MTPFHTNPEADLAFRFVTETDRHVFLTGRAGTGKTTFLERLRKDLKKSYVIVAPTGVAAINARGATIHSQLQLPFGLLSPERMRSPEARRGLAKAKEQVLRRIDLLIIDEVSMVRADVMDAIDEVLRRVRRRSEPFGGVQLLLIGDLHQLPPVVKRDEEQELSRLYGTPYFFSARALQQAGLVTVEFERIYRQSDATFIQLLGEVRANHMTPAVLDQLNVRYQPKLDLDALQGYVTLTSHRHTADTINAQRLALTPGTARQYKATVRGTFPDGNYPTEETLELKVGAQVMFVKNDPEKAFHNGKIGVVTKLEEAAVTVDCGPHGGGSIRVGQLKWENAKYSLDDRSKEVNTEVAGSFEQIPLRLAWAITIHKSQGLTFDRVIIDAEAAFAHGQVYVALSRCRSLEGIVLRTQIGTRAVHTDQQVASYSEAQRQDRPDDQKLASARVAYRQRLVREAFDFRALARSTEQFRRHGITEMRAYPGLTDTHLDGLVNFVLDKLQTIGQRFAAGQLEACLLEADLDADPTPVPQRCREGAVHFIEQLGIFEREHLRALDLESDNTEARERGEELLQEMVRELAFAKTSLELLKAETFDPQELVTRRAKLSLDSGVSKSNSRAAAGLRLARRDGSDSAPVSVVHPMLYELLKNWRTSRAKQAEKEEVKVLSVRNMRELCKSLPRGLQALSTVSGIGPVTANLYGAEIIGVINRFFELGLDKATSASKAAATSSTEAAPTPLSSVNASSSLTVSMFRQGQAIGEIAAERGLKIGTIYEHLANGVEGGMIAGEGLISGSDLARISAFLEAHDGALVGAREHFGAEFEYGLLKIGKAMWSWNKAMVGEDK